MADYIKSDTKKAKVRDKDWRQSYQVEDGGVTSRKRWQNRVAILPILTTDSVYIGQSITN